MKRRGRDQFRGSECDWEWVSHRSSWCIRRMESAGDSMKILFFNGWRAMPGEVKPTLLAQRDHEVITPKLSDDDFDEAVRTAQSEFDKQRPDVVVGLSRGGT